MNAFTETAYLLNQLPNLKTFELYIGIIEVPPQRFDLINAQTIPGFITKFSGACEQLFDSY